MGQRRYTLYGDETLSEARTARNLYTQIAANDSSSFVKAVALEI
jgi:hypothetical protein